MINCIILSLFYIVKMKIRSSGASVFDGVTIVWYKAKKKRSFKTGNFFLNLPSYNTPIYWKYTLYLNLKKFNIFKRYNICIPVQTDKAVCYTVSQMSFISETQINFDNIHFI